MNHDFQTLLRSCFPCIIVFLICTGSVFATNIEPTDDANSNPKHRSAVTSHLRHFIVTHMPQGDAVEVAVWAESVYQKMSDWVGQPIPERYVRPLVISAEWEAGDVSGRAKKSQTYSDDGYLLQQLTLVNPETMDQEDALEALSSLLISRWAHARLPGSRRKSDPAFFPDWLTTGVAQNLYPEFKQRNLEVIEDMERRNEYKPASSVLLYEVYSPGRWPEKAMAGLVVAWISETIAPAAWFASASEQINRRKPIDESFVLTSWELQGVRDMNIAWDIWMARQSRRIVPGVLNSDSKTIEEILEMKAEDLGLVFPDEGYGGRITPELLISSREKVWAKQVGYMMSWRLREELIGKTPELLAVMQKYLVFFEGIAGVSTAPGKKAKKISDRALHNYWRNATRAWSDYLRKEEDRRAYLDDFSTRTKAESQSNSQPLQEMMDRWEKVIP